MSDSEYIISDSGIGYRNNPYIDSQLRELYYRKSMTSNLCEEMVDPKVSALNELKEQFKELKEENKRLNERLERLENWKDI